MAGLTGVTGTAYAPGRVTARTYRGGPAGSTAATMSPAQVVALVQGQMSQAQPWSATLSFWEYLGGSTATLVQGLALGGWSKSKIQTATHYTPSFLSQLLAGAGQAAILPVPGSLGAALTAGAAEAGAEGTGAAAAGAGAGAGGGAGASAAKSALGTVAKTAVSAATSSTGIAGLSALVAGLQGWNALRIVKLIGGLLLAYFGVRQLASAGGANIRGVV